MTLGGFSLAFMLGVIVNSLLARYEKKVRDETAALLEKVNVRYITMWRKTEGEVLDWSHEVTGDQVMAQRLVANLKDQGVHQYHTYKLGAFAADLSSEY